MILTSSDIRTSPLTIEKSLTDYFKMARSWGAVLLIDEADVFMERRTTADLVRNSLVAGEHRNSPLPLPRPTVLRLYATNLQHLIL